MRLFWTALAALILLPSATAGSLAHPNLIDPAGDTETEAPLPVGGDILRAWVHDETATTFQVTLQLAEVTPAPVGQFDLYWGQLGLSGGRGSAVHGVRATFQPAAYNVVHVKDGAPTAGETIEGRFEAGIPGTITWTVPTSMVGIYEGDLMGSFQSFTYIPTPNNTAVFVDKALVKISYHQFGLAKHVAGFQAPAGEAPWLDEEGAIAGTLGDFRGFWPAFDADWASFTFAFATLDFAPLAGCGSGLKFTVSSGLDSPRLRVSSGIHPGPNGTNGLEYWIMQASYDGDYTNVTYDMVVGTPGYVRVRLPASEWKGSTDASDTLFDAHVLMGDTCAARSFDSFENYPDETFGLPAPAFLWAVASIVGLLLFLRRRP